MREVVVMDTLPTTTTLTKDKGNCDINNDTDNLLKELSAVDGLWDIKSIGKPFIEEVDVIYKQGGQ